MDQNAVKDYADDMQGGDSFPPVVVYRVGAELWLMDGFHRLEAAKLCGKPEIDAEIHEGTRLDAFTYGVSTNVGQNALRRSNADKRCAVQVAIRELGNLSAREIADKCGVSHAFAAKILNKLSTVDSSGARPKRIGKDGKERSLPKPAIKSKKKTTVASAPKAQPNLAPEHDFATGAGSDSVATGQPDANLETATTPPPKSDHFPGPGHPTQLSEQGKRIIALIERELLTAPREEIPRLMDALASLGIAVAFLRDRPLSAGAPDDFRRPNPGELAHYVQQFTGAASRYLEAYNRNHPETPAVANHANQQKK